MPPKLVIGRTGEIQELTTRLREGVSTLLYGDRRIGKTTVCDAACGEVHDSHAVVKIEVPERRGSDSTDLLQSVLSECGNVSSAPVARKALKGIRPMLEKLLKDEGIPLDLTELAAEGEEELPVRRILSLPTEVARMLNVPVVFFLDELQRTGDYTDGETVVRDLVDIYSGHDSVTVLIDGSDARGFELLERDVQLDKLCSRMEIGETIPARVWREALPGRFAEAELELAPEALELIVEFGAERPYATMLAARLTALNARRLKDGSPVGELEATMAIDEAQRQLNLGGPDG